MMQWGLHEIAYIRNLILCLALTGHLKDPFKWRGNILWAQLIVIPKFHVHTNHLEILWKCRFFTQEFMKGNRFWGLESGDLKLTMPKGKLSLRSESHNKLPSFCSQTAVISQACVIGSYLSQLPSTIEGHLSSQKASLTKFSRENYLSTPKYFRKTEFCSISSWQC